MRIVWLASYPKSGNTWLRFLLHGYLFGEVSASDEVSRRIPDLHTLDGRAPQVDTDPVLMKTHLLAGVRHPLFDRSAGFIYVLRHPKDVLLSNLNYFKLSRGEDLSEPGFARQFIASLGVKQWRDVGMGSWNEHAASWLTAASSLPHLVLRYEDMKRAPSAELSRVVHFLGLPFDEQKLERAVRFASFDNMRKLEDHERASGAKSRVFTIGEQPAARRFLNAGQTGQTLAHIAPELDAAFDEQFGSMMRLLGYV